MTTASPTTASRAADALGVVPLAAPLRELANAVGSGLLPTANPYDALVRSAARIEDAHTTHRHALTGLVRWGGPAAEAAQATAADAQRAAGRLSDRSLAIADVVEQAAADIATGNRRLAHIVEDFLAKAGAAVPELLGPAGVAILVALATDHLRQALRVVNTTRAKLDALARTLARLLPPPDHLPAPIGPVPLPPARPPRTAPLCSAEENLVRVLSTSAAHVADAVARDLGSTLHAAGVGPVGPHGSGAFGMPLPSGSGSSAPAPSDTGLSVRLPNGRVVIAPNKQAATAVRAALTQLGVRYVWGGNTPGRALDCSGLTTFAYGQAGIDLPRLAQDQAVGAHIGSHNVMPGDLAVWNGHVAMVVGNGQMIEAGDPVEISPIRTENEGMRFYGFFRPTA